MFFFLKIDIWVNMCNPKLKIFYQKYIDFYTIFFSLQYCMKKPKMLHLSKQGDDQSSVRRYEEIFCGFFLGWSCTFLSITIPALLQYAHSIVQNDFLGHIQFIYFVPICTSIILFKIITQKVDSI